MHSIREPEKTLDVCCGHFDRLRHAGPGFVFLLVLAWVAGFGLKAHAEPDAPSKPIPQNSLESVRPASPPVHTPPLRTAHEAEIWNLVWKHSERYGVTSKALAMYYVLWEESRLVPGARSPCGRYHGIGQFTLVAFQRGVAQMKRLGLIVPGARFSPLNPDHAIEVMAWLWSEGHTRLWGPYRRVERRLAKKAEPPSR
ncbi:MAG: hypothetical protein IT186_20240 [Acidobacteria bacterium]|nr:hypothetical protein [Acidobacteriota bacterium]